MRQSPIALLPLLLFAGSASAQMDPDPPFRDGDAISLRATPDGRATDPGRTCVADLDGDLEQDLIFQDHAYGTLNLMWAPGVQECLEADVASVIDFGVMPGDKRDDLLLLDSGGLHLLSFDGQYWLTTAVAPSWAGVQCIETYQEPGGGVHVFGLGANSRTLYHADLSGMFPVLSVLFTVPFDVIDFEPYDRSGTANPGIAVMIDAGLALYSLAGALQAYHPHAQSWTGDGITALRHGPEDHDRIALVTTMPDGVSQYLVILDEGGILSTPGLWSDRDVNDLKGVDYDDDGYEDLVMTCENHATVAVLVNRGTESPSFLLSECVYLPPPGGPVPIGTYRGMAAAGDVDNDGDVEVLAVLLNGRLAVHLNQTEAEADLKPSIWPAGYAPLHVSVASLGLTTDLTFTISPRVPEPGVFVELSCYRQEQAGEATAAEPVWYGLVQRGPGSTVTFHNVDLDGPLGADEFDDGRYYYLLVRCVEREDDTTVDVYPAQVSGLHLSRFLDFPALPENYADQYLRDMVQAWNPFDVDPEDDPETGDIYVGRGCDIPAVPILLYE